jgi:hypothetical protein
MKNYNWLLVDKAGMAVPNGARLKTRDGEEYELTGGRPPMHEASTGRVWVKSAKEGAREFYPNVFDLKWEIV